MQGVKNKIFNNCLSCFCYIEMQVKKKTTSEMSITSLFKLMNNNKASNSINSFQFKCSSTYTAVLK